MQGKRMAFVLWMDRMLTYAIAAQEMLGRPLMLSLDSLEVLRIISRVCPNLSCHYAIVSLIFKYLKIRSGDVVSFGSGSC